MVVYSACPWGDSDLPPDKEPPSLQKLQDFSRRQWESVLLLMFGTNTKAHDEVMHLYQQTGLLEAYESHFPSPITIDL